MTVLVLLAALLVPRGATATDPCATTTGQVSGVVTASGGGPIAGASVQVQGCLTGAVTTDGVGAFTLAVPDGSHVIAATAPGHAIGCYENATPDCVTVIGGATGLAIALDPLPADDDPAHVFRDPEQCQMCHAAIYEQWSRSTMAITNGNRWVENLYNGTDILMPAGPPADPLNPPYFGFLASHVRRNGDGSVKLGKDGQPVFRYGECANCHQPEYVGTDPTNTSFNAFMGPEHHAITCDFCHKIVDVDVSPDGIRRPNLVVGEYGHAHGGMAKTTMLRSASEPQLVFGPLGDVTFEAPEMRAAFAPITGSSRLCASCHEDHADPRDANDDFVEVYDGPPSQTTYSEWASSPYAAQGVECQDCHMPPTGAESFCDRTSNVRDPSQVRDHSFPGTTPEFLGTAARLRARTEIADGVLAVHVDVTNEAAGHHLPTGVTLRHMLLSVVATTRDGEALEQLPQADGGGSRVPNWGGSGGGDLAQRVTDGNLAGLAGKGFARVLVDENLNENVIFTEAVSAFDNRIPAGATDATTYRFTLPADFAKRDVRVDTSLWYRKAFKPLADQRKWSTPTATNPHGVDGLGRDFDVRGTLMERRRNLLTCRGKLLRLRAEGLAAEGTLVVTGVLKLPKKTAIDPGRDGVVVRLGVADAVPEIDDLLEGFGTDGTSVVHASTVDGGTREVRLTPAGKRGFKMVLGVGGVTADVLGADRLALGIDSGDVCSGKALKCKTKGSTVRCR